jgi:TP901 family phage tail tape measure protein
LNAVAEAAGQLGIAKGDIVGFTKTMADLGETTDLTSEQAATSIAQFQNIFGEAGKNVENFGSTLVALGNAGASTESQILDMGLRIAGAGDQIGLTQGQVLAIASSLASVGIEAEAGGSAISKVMIDMALAVEKGGDRLDQFAQVAGVSSKEFEASFKQDAAEALTTFISGLGEMETRGGSALGVLDAMGISEVRMRDALLRSAGAGDLLTQSLQLQANAWSENTALTNEAAKRYETFESQLKFAKARINDIAITFGTALMPALLDLLKVAEPLMSMLANTAKAFVDLPGPVRTVIAVMGGLVIAAGPVIFVAGQMITAWATVSGVAAPALVTAFNAVRAAAMRLAAVNPLAWIAGGLLLVNELIVEYGELQEEQTVLNVEMSKSIGVIADLRNEYGKLTEAQLESAYAAVQALQAQRESAFRERMQLEDQIKALEERNARAKAGFSLGVVRTHGGDGQITSEREYRVGMDVPEAGGGNLQRNKAYQDLKQQAKELATEEKNLANIVEFANDKLEAHRQKLKEGEKVTKTATSAVNILTDEQKKLGDEFDNTTKSISQNIELNKKIIAAINGGATEREIDDLKTLHEIHVQYLSDVEELGEKAANAIRDLRLEEERTKKALEKANLALEVRNKHLDYFDNLDKSFTGDVELDASVVNDIERAAELTKAVRNEEELRLEAIAEAQRLLDKQAISQETYRRILQENSTWIEADKTAWEKQLETIDRISVEVASWAGAFANLFDGFDKGVANALRGIGQMAEAWQAARAAQTTGEAIGAGMAGGQGVFQAGQGLGLWQGNRGTGSFGGQMSGDYADIGSQVGAVIGTFIMPGIGTIIGGIIGGLVGGAIKMGADEGLAKLEEVGGEISVQVRKAEGGLGDPISKLGQGVKEAVEGILGAFGATLNELDNVWIKIRDDVITVTVGQMKARFDEMGDAVSFAVAEILKQADITGLSDVMRTVLENTEADSTEALTAELQFGQWYERLGLASIVGSIRDALIKFRADMHHAAKLGLSEEPIAEDYFRNMANMRDALLGIQRDPEEQLNREIDAWNRELDLMDAQEAAREADLLIQSAELKAKLAIFEANRHLTENELLLRMSMLDAEYQIFNTQASLYESLLASLEGVEAALAIIRGIREGIAGMGISEEEREEALRRLRAQRGGSGQRTDQVADFIDDRTFELSLRGVSDYRRQVAELTRQYDDLLEQAGRDEAQRTRLIALREQELELMRQEEVTRLVDSFREFMNLGNPFDQIRRTAQDLIDSIKDSPLGDARQANMINRVLGEMDRQVRQLSNQMTANLLGNLIGDLERFGAQESEMSQARIYMAMLEHQLKLENYRRELAIIKLQGTMAPEVIKAMEDMINFISGIDPTQFIGNVAANDNRPLRGQALQDAIQDDKDMVANGGKPTSNDRGRARDLLSKYLDQLEDPLTQSLNQINDDFALIIKELGNTPEIIKAKNDAIQQAVDQFLEPLRKAQLDLATGDLSVLDAQGRFGLLEDEFDKMRQAFAAGDLSVLKDAPGLLQDLLKVGVVINPIGSEAYKELFDAVNLFYQQVQDQITQQTGTIAPQPIMTVSGMDRLSDIAESQLAKLQVIGETNAAMLANLRSINEKIANDSGLRNVA